MMANSFWSRLKLELRHPLIVRHEINNPILIMASNHWFVFDDVWNMLKRWSMVDYSQWLSSLVDSRRKNKLPELSRNILLALLGTTHSWTRSLSAWELWAWPGDTTLVCLVLVASGVDFGWCCWLLGVIRAKPKFSFNFWNHPMLDDPLSFKSLASGGSTCGWPTTDHNPLGGGFVLCLQSQYPWVGRDQNHQQQAKGGGPTMINVVFKNCWQLSVMALLVA